MWTIEVLRARAFRLALAFALTITLATSGAFYLIYLRVTTADVAWVEALLIDESAKSVGDSEDRLRRALDLRLTRDLRRLDYVALFDGNGALTTGNVPTMPAIAVDGRAHLVREFPVPGSNDRTDSAIFVARRRPDGGVLLLGRSLLEVYALREAVSRALAIALAPTVLLILAIGLFFAGRGSRRLARIHNKIADIMNGDLGARLPETGEGDDVDKVASAVNLMLDEINRLLDQLKSVGDNIAHDLRSPLAVARAKIEGGLAREATVEDLRAAMADALDHLDRAAVTIAALLRISAVENGPREKTFEEVDLSAICAGVFDFYEPLAQANALDLTLDAPKPTLVRGDQDLMREAISNLVDNAIKFTPAGGKVRIEAATVDGRPLVRVSDTGRGIPPQERERIFRRFYQVERDGRSSGHGLGLSIAETIAKLHGFNLTVEDNNPGARFELRGADKASLALETARS
ncbi:MAG: HAMP domain-containing sensor histidine kinase [Roseiarcus sp.]|jgi:signal transduction histidine kinase